MLKSTAFLKIQHSAMTATIQIQQALFLPANTIQLARAKPGRAKLLEHRLNESQTQ